MAQRKPAQKRKKAVSHAFQAGSLEAPSKKRPPARKRGGRASKGSRKRVVAQSGAERQQKYRKNVRDNIETDIRHACEVAQKRTSDCRIEKDTDAQFFWMSKAPDLLCRGFQPPPSKSTAEERDAFKERCGCTLPKEKDKCMFVKTERGVQFLQTGECVRVATAFHCAYPGETYILFDNMTHRGVKRRILDKRPKGRRLYAVRSLFVARLPKNQISANWSRTLFQQPTVRVPWKRPSPKAKLPIFEHGSRTPSPRKPARVPRKFKHSKAERAAKRIAKSKLAHRS